MRNNKLSFKILILIFFLGSCKENSDQIYKELIYKELPRNFDFEMVIKNHNTFLKNNEKGNRAIFDSLKINNHRFSGHYDWSEASFKNTYLYNLDLGAINFSNADFTNAYFENVNFIQGNISSRFDNANMLNVIFEPHIPPSAINIITAKNLFTMRYYKNPTGLIKLKNDFHDSGFLDHERKIIHALMKEKTRRIDSIIHRYFRIILFDWTCAYGMDVWRPILLLLMNIMIFAVLYFLLTMFSKKSKIIPVKNRHVGDLYKTEKVEYPIWEEKVKSTGKTYLNAISKLIEYSILFSFMSAFNYGFREINFGRWIRNLLHEDIDIKTTRWARTASGIQSIICLYLFALWLLIYFSNPFEQLI